MWCKNESRFHWIILLLDDFTVVDPIQHHLADTHYSAYSEVAPGRYEETVTEIVQ